MTTTTLAGMGQAWRQHLAELRASVHALVVDDEPIVHEVIAEILRGIGWQVEIAESVEAAWKRIQAGGLHLLLADKNLPDGSGVELIARVKAAGLELPSLVVTGFASVESISQALAAGAEDYLIKPFEDVRHLGRRAEAVLDRHLLGQLYRRVVGDLTAALSAGGLPKDAVKRLAHSLDGYKRELTARPGVLLVAPEGPEAEALAATLRAAGLSLGLAHDRKSALLALEGPLAPLTAVLSLRLHFPSALISELREVDPLLYVVATTSSPRLEDALAAVDAGARDYFIQAVESPAALAARVKRAVESSHRDRLYLQLIASLHREAASLGGALAQDLAAVLPEAQRAYLLRASLETALELPEIELDLTGLFDTAPSELRRHPRVDARDVEVWFRARGRAQEFRRGWLRDLSRGGFFLRVSPPPERDTPLEAHLLVRGEAPTAANQVIGRVVRVERHDPDPELLSGCGVLVEESSQAALDPLVARLTRT
ncbi:MAG TPA: response regulator [Myxococcota bacterium]|nr:response regulator [Myxococcota bacterium]HRY96042.1 response regulator [Myxococcota bacterium]